MNNYKNKKMSPINFKLIFKHLKNNPLFGVISIIGFAISLTFIILLSNYIKHEYAVDQFHENKDRIYRLYHEGGGCHFAYKVGKDLKNMYPEIKNFTAVYEQENIMKWKNRQIQFNHLLVDSSFFNMFSFKLIQGNKSEVLKSKNSIVISKTFARKMFHDQSPLGEEVVFSDKKFIVTGIMEDFPDNTHFKKPDGLINFTVLADIRNYPQLLTTYENNSFGIYFLVKENADIQSKTSQVLDYLKNNHWMYKQGRTKIVAFEPLKDIYFSDAEMPGVKRNSKTLLHVLTAIVILILILAIINYTNLTITQSTTHEKEMAIRKILGSSKGRIIWYFISESVFICFIGTIIAIILSILVQPLFNNLLDTNLDIIQSFSLSTIFFMLLLLFIVGIISGIFPALVITRVNPVNIIKGAFKINTSYLFPKGLLSFQYCVVIVLLISTWLISKQTHFMQNKDIGFTKENIVWFKNHISIEHRNAFRNELKNIAGVNNVAFVRGSPLDGGNNNSYVYNGRPVSFQTFHFDSAFIKMMDIKIIPTGVAYSENGVYLNETAVKKLELGDQPNNFKFYDRTLPILGITEDFNFNSLHEKIGPAIIRQMSPNHGAWAVFVKIAPHNTLQILQKIKKQYKHFSYGKPVEINFVDTTVNSWYKKEANNSKIIAYFTFLTIIISVMGIFAMSLFYAQEHTKEIGIRKVNGARISEILTMLNIDFIKWIIIAFIIACPIAWYAMTKWLENFAYKTEISWWMFALAGIIALVIAMVTVSWQSWRAARRNPVEALRYE